MEASKRTAKASKRNISARNSIKIFLTDEEMNALDVGPLFATGGKGRASWLRALALREIQAFWRKA